MYKGLYIAETIYLYKGCFARCIDTIHHAAVAAIPCNGALSAPSRVYSTETRTNIGVCAYPFSTAKNKGYLFLEIAPYIL